MYAKAVLLDLKICSMISILLFLAHLHGVACMKQTSSPQDLDSIKLLVMTGKDIVKSTYVLLDTVEHIKQTRMNTPSYEIGYLMFTTFEMYKKMIEKFNTSHTMGLKLYTLEHIIYLQEVENHYWELDHLSNMLHETERKYNVTSTIKTVYAETNVAALAADKDAQKEAKEKFVGKRKVVRRPTTTRVRMADRIKITRTPKRPSRFPLDYGWDYPNPEDTTTISNKRP